MSANQCDIGLIGLAVMGENLVLNMESKGFSVAVFNRTTEVTEKFAAGREKIFGRRARWRNSSARSKNRALPISWSRPARRSTP
jgi:6-phosphogluconate dehydrogenase (decarboxylating)